MWITKDIEIPEQVISALKEDKLVIFAGAGVSAGPPSNIPTFQELAEEVGSQCNENINKRKLDRFLGDLEDKGIEVHQIVLEIIQSKGLSPCDLHYDLLRLFNDVNDVRIVTTNFDPLLSVAANETGETHLRTYYAPALPLGNKFNGIVCLHGCISEGKESLVLTDRDFGRAYLTEGWATRFLIEVFSKYTVLFIGYSHNDVVMQYLARGLPPRKDKENRYAFVPLKEQKRWSPWGVKVITYPIRRGRKSHGALYEAVNKLVKLSKMGLLEHEERIRQLVQRPHPSSIILGKEEESYLEYIIEDPIKFRLFAEYAESPEWLKWIDGKGLLDSLFQLDRVLDELDIEKARWIVKQFVIQYPQEILNLIRLKNQILHPVLRNMILDYLWRTTEDIDSKDLVIWTETLLHMNIIDKEYNECLRLLLWKASEKPKFIDTVLVLFDYLTSPRLKLEHGFNYKSGEKVDLTDFQIVILGDIHQLNEIWNKKLKPNIGLLSNRLFPMVLKNIRMAYFLLENIGKVNENWDPISYRRPAIEPHKQNYLRRDIDILIDVARDILEFFLKNDYDYAMEIIKIWSRSDSMLLKRLAVHGIAKSNLISGDDKIKLVLKKDWLFSNMLHHEIYILLKLSYSSATEEVRKLLVKEIDNYLKKGEEENDKYRDFEVYKLLTWLNHSDPNCELINERLNKIRLKYPSIKPSEHPDFRTWISGVQQVISPIPYEKLLKSNPSKIFDFILNYREEPGSFHSRNALLSEVANVIASSYEWGWEITKILRQKGEWETDLWEYIIRGWSQSELKEEEWETILNLLCENPQLLAINNPDEIYRKGIEVARLLNHGVEREKGEIPSSLLDKAKEIALELWNSLNQIDEEERKEKIECGLGRAINHPGGILAMFWLHIIYRIRKQEEDSWEGIPSEYKDILVKMINSNSYSSFIVIDILSSYIHFLFALDREWTLSKILPLLDWNKNENIAKRAWCGFLSWSNWNEALLPKLVPYYKQCINKLSKELSEMREHFSEHITSIFLFSSDGHEIDELLKKFLITVEEVDRVNFASKIYYYLINLSHYKTSIETVWSERLKDYWEKRIKGIPIRLTPLEIREMIEWVLELEDVFPQVVELFINTPVTNLQNPSIYHHLSESAIINKYPEDVVKFLSHLLSGTVRPFYGCEEMEEIIVKLSENNIPPQSLRKLGEELMRFGCNENVTRIKHLWE